MLWSARHRYPYIALNTTIEMTKKIWETYDNAAAEAGYKSGPEQHGYLLRCHVAETDEKALENARNFMWMQGEFIGIGHPVWANPTGYYLARDAQDIRADRGGSDSALCPQFL